MVKSEHKIQTGPSTKQTATSPTTSTSCKKKYKGVRMRSWGSWVSEIRAPNQKTRIWLGSYSTAEAAARAYDAALLCLKGSSANLNFPITSPSYYVPDTVLSPKAIQRVAAAAANNFIDNVTTTTNATAATTSKPISPPPHSTTSSSSSFVSSPALSDQVDDDVARIPSIVANDNMLESWYPSIDSLQFPKYVDQIFNVPSFDPLPFVFDDFYEEGDIRLWSFC